MCFGISFEWAFYVQIGSGSTSTKLSCWAAQVPGTDKPLESLLLFQCTCSAIFKLWTPEKWRVRFVFMPGIHQSMKQHCFILKHCVAHIIIIFIYWNIWYHRCYLYNIKFFTQATTRRRLFCWHSFVYLFVYLLIYRLHFLVDNVAKRIIMLRV